MHSEHADVGTDPAQPPPSTFATAAGPAPRHGDTNEGWKKVERRRNGKGEKREAGFGREVGVPSWADKARGRGGVSATVFIGENRDARPRGGWSRVGPEAEELPLFLPTPSFMISAGKREN